LITAIHLLVTYRCTRSCSHCFVWGSPAARGVLKDDQARDYLQACRGLGLTGVSFEGGEPMLYPDLVAGWIEHATELGLEAGLVSNGFWALDRDRADQVLTELKKLGLSSLMVSCDDYHGGAAEHHRALAAVAAAEPLGLATILAVTDREQVMYRGRAAELLAPDAAQRPATELTCCPHEDLAAPARVHLDYEGNIHLCQGLTMGQAADGRSLVRILEAYDPESHPIVSPLLEGGPLALADAYALRTASHYADACHLCYESRRRLRDRFPEYLGPDHVYGVD